MNHQSAFLSFLVEVLMQDILKVSHITAGYGDVHIVRDVSFSIKPKEVLGIVGESGCGKSTLLKAVMNIRGMTTEIKGGTILFDDKDLAQLTKEEQQSLWGKDISMVFQNASASLHPTRKIGIQFYETLAAHGGMDKAAAQKLISSIFNSIGLLDVDRILSSYPFELSGGMAQRVAIALAVLLRPKLILADEPTSALDATIQKQVIEELMALRDQLGTAILIITHNIGVVGKMADYVGVMYGGRIVEYGPTKEVLEHPGHPYTKALLDAVPKLNGVMPAGLEGHPPRFDTLGEGCSFYDRCAYRCDDCKSYDFAHCELGLNHYVLCSKGGSYE